VALVLDFDDTLFPTSWFSEHQFFTDWMRHQIEGDVVLEQLGPENREELHELDLSARAFVLAASQLGTINCVTMSKRPWVTRCLQNFMPRLAELWQDLEIEVVYCRDIVVTGTDASNLPMAIVRNEDPDEMAMAKDGMMKQKKCKAMKRVLQRFYQQGSWKNVISIGDSFSERDALREIGFQHRNPVSATSGSQKPFRVKTVKLKETPPCAVLTAELQALHSWLPALADHDDDLDVDLDGDEDELGDATDAFVRQLS
jgi:hypothetical protein